MTKVIEPADIYKNISLEDLPDEIWKDTIGYEGAYQISSLGRLKSLSRMTRNHRAIFYTKTKILKPYLDTYGYCCFSLFSNTISNRCYTHRLVAKAFIQNPEDKPCVNHKNGIKTDNRVENLEWVTPRENVIHAHQTGLATVHRGVDKCFSKLKNQEVVEIKKALREGTIARILSKKYKISLSVIYHIKHGRAWKHL